MESILYENDFNSISSFNLQWIAGIFEGEGSCGCYEHNKHTCYTIKFSIANTDLSMLKEIQKLIGVGSIVEKPVYQKHHKKSYVYILQAKRARKFLNILLPYIRSNYKKNQIEKTLKLDKQKVKGII